VAEEGVETVEGEMYLLFPLLRNYLGTDVDLIHFIWTHPFFIVGDYTGSHLLDAVLSYGRAVLFVLDLLAVRLLGAAFVWTVHNRHNHERYHVRLDHTVSRLLARLVDEFTVECERAKWEVVDLFGAPAGRVHVVPEGSYVGSYPDEVGKREARDRLGVDDDAFLFVYFGQLREYKEVPSLVEAFRALDVPDARLLVAGNPYTDEIEARVGGLVAATDGASAVFEFVPNEEVQLYMNAADVVTLPYREIMTSGSVLLAMSFGRAVVAPSLGCIPVLVDEDGAFLYDRSAPDGLRAAMRAAYDEGPERLERMGDANYDRATAMTWDEVGTETVEIYERAFGLA
jgi:glycosyltransferase involved in cell wall biosynthesis